MVAASLAMRWSLSDIWNSAAFLEIASALSTLILIIGAVVEDWPKLKQIVLLTAKRILFRATAFERCVLRKLLVHSVGAIMVVIGIAGELIFETRTFIVEDRETATLSIEAGNAAGSALKAEGAADKAIGDEKLLKADFTQAESDVKSAKASSLEAQQHATAIGSELAKEIDREQAAERQLEGEKVKRLKLAASLLPREIFDQSGMMNSLSVFSPHRVLFVYADTHESKQYAEQLAWAFASLRWPVVGRVVDQDLLTPGVSVTCGRGINMHEFGNELRDGEELAASIKKIFSDDGVDLSTLEIRGKETSEYQRVEGEIEEPPSVLLIGIGPQKNRELEEALRELGAPEASPIAGDFLTRPGQSPVKAPRGTTMAGNRFTIPPDPTFKPNSRNP